jgi:phosphoribosylformimino-5-aminoimidazole carboxamide ribotide isomerase
MLRNLSLIKDLVSSVNLYIQVGGGIRDLNIAEQILNAGVNRIIIGSAIVKNPQMVKDALKHFGPDKVVVGLDCRDGYLAINGWQENSKIKAIDIAKEYKEHYGLKNVIYTDIHRDGTLQGPNITELIEFMTATGIDTIASGGISGLDDIKLLINHLNQNQPLRGVVVGKALYAKKIQPSALFNLNVGA